jgi:hypothetical protein
MAQWAKKSPNLVTLLYKTGLRKKTGGVEESADFISTLD